MQQREEPEMPAENERLIVHCISRRRSRRLKYAEQKAVHYVMFKLFFGIVIGNTRSMHYYYYYFVCRKDLFNGMDVEGMFDEVVGN